MNASRPIEAIVQTGPAAWRQFRHPVRIVEASAPHGVSAALDEIERLTRDKGYYAVGYVAYEAAAAYGLQAFRGFADGGPLAWFALFEPGEVRDIESPPEGGAYRLGTLTPTSTREAFRAAIDRIKAHLAEGDTYQVNFTFRMRGAFEGDPKALFADLVRAQQGRYSAFISTGDRAICSASPELFFALDGLEISARPMKGTAPRGRTPAEDLRRSAELRASDKQRAENVMIVDMVRNDLGRIAQVGTVAVPELFVVERYPNVWQMTSRVTARTGASLAEIFAAVHPSASVTGAPKRRTMEIIRALEPDPRGVYTGAIGYIAPDGNGRFNVAIRTAVVAFDAGHAEADGGSGSLEFGVGSGIVWDSDPDAEYEECLLKASVLGQRPSDFELLETTAWEPRGGFTLIDSHLARMSASAAYFGFSFSEADVLAALAAAVEGERGPLRVRFLLSRSGAVRVERQPLVAWGARPVRVMLALRPVEADDPFLFHKTTNRSAYERARMDAVEVDDVILWNRRRQITEATTANVIVELADGALATPPLECGLLAGTVRAEAILHRRVAERIVTIDEVRAARRVWLTNSVHGWREAALVEAAVP